ncbi:LysR family transcriptional regulator [Guyparkeria halophila]|uniref:LysR family transcriptional regulator n=1 Tax=Guyparkeria halophila TaxID=47960 RepID=A0A6I6D261_9GAMM|nr:LysR family transcriptional regulator [Guyparkeria halophila]QGT78237.1 LysR family transcriptional regulator [Guyparkeria halophila]
MAADDNRQSEARYLLRRATLRQIEIVEAVARLGSFTRAAEELFLTQPTVSAQVKSLSETVGMPLFEQIGRKIYLTDAGNRVARGCRDVIDTLSNLEMSLNDLKGLKKGRLRLSVITTAKYFAPLAMGDFAKQFPDIEMELKVSNRDTLLKRIEDNLSDLYIIGHVPDSGLDLELIPFAPNPLVVIAHRNHPLARERNIPIERIAEEPFIMREPGSGIRNKIEEHFAQHGLKLRQRLVLEGPESIKHAVVGQLGISVVSEHALNLESEAGPLVKLDVQGFPLQRQWNIVYPRGKVLSVIAREFLAFLKEHGGDYLKIG